MANEVFISYSRRDIETVKKIKKYIDEEVGIDCWFDLDGIESGEEFKRVITSAIDKHDTILFMKTSDSMRSKFVKKEIDYAESIGKRIILVDLDHTPLTSDFRLDFCSKDNIDWYDNVQRDKLIRNLKNWFHKEKESGLDKLYSCSREDVAQYGISIISVLPSRSITIYYRGYTYECDEGIDSILKSFKDLESAIQVFKDSLHVKDEKRTGFESYLKNNGDTIAHAYNIITFCSASDLLALLRLQQNPTVLGIHRIVMESQLIPLCFDANKDSLYSIEYQYQYCDMALGGGVFEILQAGFIDEKKYDLKDFGYDNKSVIKRNLSAYDGFACLVLGAIIQYNIIHKCYYEGIVLLCTLPFEIYAEIWINGSCRDVHKLKFMNDTIPSKNTLSVEDDYCSLIVISIQGRRFKIDVHEWFGYTPKSVAITCDIDASYGIIYILKDKETGREVSISQTMLSRDEIV